ncbi:MAG: hypothetical protein ACXWF5_08870 [Actinomycetota bacterium]
MPYPPGQSVIDRDRTVELTEAEPPDRRPATGTAVDASAIDTASATTTERVELRDRVPWLVPVALGLIVALVVGGLALILGQGDPSPDDVSAQADPAQPGLTLDAPPAAANAELTIGTADSFTSTIRVGDDEDLFGTLATDPGAGSRLGGAPVSGDAVVVQQIFGADAFSVISGTSGVPVLVYLPGATDEIVAFVPGVTRVLFVGTLHPMPADLGGFLGSEPASIAARSGAYVVAVPETVVQVSPPSA